MNDKNLEQQLNNLQFFVTTARKDSDFDLFYRRVQMAQIFSTLSPEAMNTLHLTDFYSDYWNLANEAYYITKFSAEEKNISQQIFSQVQAESNPIRRQYLALTLNHKRERKLCAMTKFCLSYRKNTPH